MLTDIVRFHSTEVQEPPAPLGTIEFVDIPLAMTIRANVYGAHLDCGRIYVVIQPIAQELGEDSWMACDLDDTAFPVDVATMREIKAVR